MELTKKCYLEKMSRYGRVAPGTFALRAPTDPDVRVNASGSSSYEVVNDRHGVKETVAPGVIDVAASVDDQSKTCDRSSFAVQRPISYLLSVPGSGSWEKATNPQSVPRKVADDHRSQEICV
jgi:hypothetical protein